MFRSIQSRLISMYLLLVLVAMILAGSALQNSLQNYYLDSVRENLEIQGQVLAGLAQRSLETGDRNGINNWVQHFDTQLGVSVAVLDADGVVLGASRDEADVVGKKLRADEISHALGGSRGEAVRRDPRTQQRQLHMGLPLTVRGQVVGVIYLKASLERAYATLEQIWRFLAYATALALVVTAILGYALSRTITAPVRELTTRAAEMAGGHFDQTIQVRSNDEIGQLGSMFNHLTQRLKETLDEIRSEKNKAEAILNYMADGLLALDSQGKVILVNPAAERLLGTEQTNALGKAPGEIWPQMQLEPAVQEAHHTGNSVARTFALSRPREVILQGYVTPLKGEKKQVSGTVVVLHDVTEQQALEQMRRDFVANVSHELRTPLTTVKSYVETLLDGAVEEPDLRSRFLRVVEAETDRMVRLVRDLLHLSQLDRGKASMDLQDHALVPLLDECLTKLALPMERKHLLLQRDFPTDLPPVRVDRDKVQQVILNLLTNAIEFTPDSGEITVSLRHEHNLLRVRIEDTGIGIPAEDLPRIFERFYRVDKARSRTLGGTGLGLAIAREIILAMGGQIAIESEEDKGTVVTFSVPIASATRSLKR